MENITPERYNEVITYFHERYSVIITQAMIDALIEDDSSIYLEIIDNSYSDTFPREYMIDWFSVKSIGKHWPCNGDGDDYFNKFIKEGMDNGFIEKR